MCGRFSLHLRHEDIQNVPGYENVNIAEWLQRDQFVPRYNIAPHSQAPVIRRRRAEGDDAPGEYELVMQTMKWGLVPHWAKHEDKSLNTTNARSENLVGQGGMWGSLKGRKRCLVIADGYYEWFVKGKEKLPHFTKHKDGKPMLMAALYDCVYLEDKPGEPLWTFSIVTTSACKDFEWLHERQPVILYSEESINTWLDTSSQQWLPELAKLVNPYDNTAAPLDCYQVPREVGKVGTESPTFIEPISQRKDGIQAMFSKQSQKQKQKEDTPKKRPRSPEPPPKEIIDLASDDTPSPSPAKKKIKPSPSKKKTVSPAKEEERITKFFSK